MVSLTKALGASGRFFFRLSPLFRILSVTAYYIIGVYFYKSTENWTVIDSMYFVTVSVATIGYGDLHPTSDSGRLFTAFYLIVGLIFVLSAVDEMVRFGILKYQSAAMERIFPDNTLKDRAINKLLISFSTLCLLALGGVLFFVYNEKWSVSKALYWTVGTMMTVGYGDLHVKYSSTRLFSIFFIACCVCIYATTMYNIREFYRLSEAPLALIPDPASPRTPGASSYSFDSEDGYKQGEHLENGFSPLAASDPDASGMVADTESGGSMIINQNIHIRSDGRFVETFPASIGSGPGSASAVLPVPPRYAPKSRRTGKHSANSALAGGVAAEPNDFQSNSGDGAVTTTPNNTNNALLADMRSVVEANTTVVDPTQHLLAILEQINAGNSFAREIATLKKKYDLAVPHDHRVQMTKQELLVLCAADSNSLTAVVAAQSGNQLLDYTMSPLLKAE